MTLLRVHLTEGFAPAELSDALREAGLTAWDIRYDAVRRRMFAQVTSDDPDRIGGRLTDNYPAIIESVEQSE